MKHKSTRKIVHGKWRVIHRDTVTWLEAPGYPQDPRFLPVTIPVDNAKFQNYFYSVKKVSLPVISSCQWTWGPLPTSLVHNLKALRAKEGQMDLYVGIDLHSSNSYIGIINKNGEKIMSRREPNDKEKILKALHPYRGQIKGVAIESTYNWYWLADTLMDAGYKLHLGNPAAFHQYKGLKYINDKHDAFWLAQMLALGLLPEGYIYPKKERGLRDLLRRRSYLVRLRTSLKLSLQQICSNQAGIRLSNNAIEKMEDKNILDIFEERDWQMNGESLFSTLSFVKKEAEKIERYIYKEIGNTSYYKSLTSVSGIGEILAFTISLETGPIERFASSEQYASYCRCVPSSYWSNEKRKGQGNTKNGNRYLAWAFSEAASFCVRYCDSAKSYYQRKAVKTNTPKAYRAVANKLAKCSYYIMKGGSLFDPQRLFGS